MKTCNLEFVTRGMSLFQIVCPVSCRLILPPPLSFSTPVPDLIGDLIREGIQCLCLVPLTRYQHGHPERSACPEQREGTISSLRRSVFEGEILHFVQNDRFGVSLGIFIPMTEGTGPKTAEMTGVGTFVRVSETLLDWIRTS